MPSLVREYVVCCTAYVKHAVQPCDSPTSTTVSARNRFSIITQLTKAFLLLKDATSTLPTQCTLVTPYSTLPFRSDHRLDLPVGHGAPFHARTRAHTHRRTPTNAHDTAHMHTFLHSHTRARARAQNVTTPAMSGHMRL